MAAAALETSKDPVYESCYKDRLLTFDDLKPVMSKTLGQIKVILESQRKELKEAGTLNLPYCFSWSSMAQYDAGLGP